MSTFPFAINGLGRIGRALVRVAHQRPELELVAVNDLAPAATLARLLARDSVHGRFPAAVELDGDSLRIDGRRVEVFCEPNPAAIPWHQTHARLVVESTGVFNSRDQAALHLRSPHGPRKVLVAGIAHDTDIMLCHGVNDGDYEDAHQVISNASCTSQCLALLIDVLDREVGVRRAMMNEVHSYTGNQNLLDGANRDPRRARSAALNIVPTFTAAPAAVERAMPHLVGRLSGMAVRVPTPNVALLELYATVKRPVTADAVCEFFRQAADGRLQGLLATSDEPLVSSDYIGATPSAIVDTELVSCTGDLCRVLAWYDNEWGYTHRLADLIEISCPRAELEPTGD